VESFWENCFRKILIFPIHDKDDVLDLQIFFLKIEFIKTANDAFSYRWGRKGRVLETKEDTSFGK
jgi:hypothetical protein